MSLKSIPLILLPAALALLLVACGATPEVVIKGVVKGLEPAPRQVTIDVENIEFTDEIGAVEIEGYHLLAGIPMSESEIRAQSRSYVDDRCKESGFVLERGSPNFCDS